MEHLDWSIDFAIGVNEGISWGRYHHIFKSRSYVYCLQLQCLKGNRVILLPVNKDELIKMMESAIKYYL